MVWMGNKHNWNTRPDYDRRAIIGKKFNRLTCVRFVGIGSRRKLRYIFRCDCGKEKERTGSLVTSGLIKSCGCIARKEGTLDHIYYNHYKRAAYNRGYPFNITFKAFKKLFNSPCYYCKTKPYKEFSNGGSCSYSIIVNGIDRVNNKLGYSAKNCVACCEKCNKAKRMLTVDEFKTWVTLVYNNFIKER